jgi:hypothetical protein
MSVLIQFEGLTPVVRLGVVDEKIVGALRAVLNGWHFSLIEDDGRPAAVTIARRRRGYVLKSFWLDEELDADTAVGAVTSLIVDLGYAFAAEDSARLCLHAGAVEFGGKLVVFPSAARAGKSTLIAALGMAGRRVFSDDLLPILGESGQAVALGTRPRLRLPLARGTGGAFRDFVGAHEVAADEQHLFLGLPPELHAAYGETAPIGAFVMLDRRQVGPAELVAAERGEGLRRMVLQSLATPNAADTVFVRLQSLIERYPAWTLRYSRLDEAVALLNEHFADWSALPDAAPIAEEPAPWANAPSIETRPDADITNGPRYLRNPDAALHGVGAEAFLVHPARGGIYALNAVALGVWNLLAVPQSRGAVAGLIAEAFPDADPKRIRRDVRLLVRDLVECDLVRPAGPA